MAPIDALRAKGKAFFLHQGATCIRDPLKAVIVELYAMLVIQWRIAAREYKKFWQLPADAKAKAKR